MLSRNLEGSYLHRAMSRAFARWPSTGNMSTWEAFEDTSELSGDDNLDIEVVEDQIQELHFLSAQLQCCKDLIVTKILKSVGFVLTPNPAMQAPSVNGQADSEMRKILDDELRECETLLLEIGRLEEKCVVMELRLKNVMASTEINDNEQRLFETSMANNAAMRQLTYLIRLIMCFLPAVVVAKIVEIDPTCAGTLAQFLTVALSSMTLLIYVVIAYRIEIKVPCVLVEDEDDASTSGHARRCESEEDTLKLSALERVFWPIVLMREHLQGSEVICLLS